MPQRRRAFVQDRAFRRTSADDDDGPAAGYEPAGGSDSTAGTVQAAGQMYGGPGQGMATFPRNPDQSLPIVSIALGAASMVFICCYGGIWLGLPAAIVGFLGMRNADSDPERYGGKGLAIGGIVLGIISFILTILMFVFAILAPQF